MGAAELAVKVVHHIPWWKALSSIEATARSIKIINCYINVDKIK
jgi:hypothetical protein